MKDKKVKKLLEAKQEALMSLIEVMEDMELDQIKGFKKKKKGMTEVLDAKREEAGKENESEECED